MSKQKEESPAGPAKAHGPETEDAGSKELIANARRIADERAAATEEQLKIQAHYEKVQGQMRKGAAKTRSEEA
jgi:hypothetical protein